MISPAIKKLKLKKRLITALPLLKRLLIITVGLSIIITFIYTQPATANQLYQRALTTLKLTSTPSPTPPPSPIEDLNSARRQASLPDLSSNDQLTTIANLLALAIAANPDADPEDSLDIKTTAAAAGYDYSVISYLAVINPFPLIQLPQATWLRDDATPILNSEFTQVGFSHQIIDDNLISVLVLASPQSPTPTTNSTAPTPTFITSTPPSLTYYTGTQLWTAIQDYRRQHGVPEFQQDNTLCTLASIRVNQILELGKLDNHDGFKPLVDQYRDSGQLTHHNIAENILSGYPTAADAVAGWDSSLGHQALLKDGSYVYGCAAANSGFAVLIAAF